MVSSYAYPDELSDFWDSNWRDYEKRRRLNDNANCLKIITRFWVTEEGDPPYDRGIGELDFLYASANNLDVIAGYKSWQDKVEIHFALDQTTVPSHSPQRLDWQRQPPCGRRHRDKR